MVHEYSKEVDILDSLHLQNRFCQPGAWVWPSYWPSYWPCLFGLGFTGSRFALVGLPGSPLSFVPMSSWSWTGVAATPPAIAGAKRHRSGHVLTAAHCVSGPSDTQVFIRGSEGKLVFFDVAAIAVHPGYRPNSGQQDSVSIDLALLRLAKPLSPNSNLSN